MRKVLKGLLLLPILYVLLLGGFFFAMSQTPELFVSIISRTPRITFAMLPFRPMWLRARSGRLKIGDEAPDFALDTYDKRSRVQLSELKGKRPVVLVFGSYT